jgi:N-acylglucosamine 2-epimerase
MILLNVIYELRGEEASATPAEEKKRAALYEAEAGWCIIEVCKHVKADKKCVLENVHAKDGSVMLETAEGRLLNPGHAIEAGWFLMQFARRWPVVDAAALNATALNMIDWSFDKGWDRQYGGLFYFLDSVHTIHPTTTTTRTGATRFPPPRLRSSVQV